MTDAEDRCTLCLSVVISSSFSPLFVLFSVHGSSNCVSCFFIPCSWLSRRSCSLLSILNLFKISFVELILESVDSEALFSFADSNVCSQLYFQMDLFLNLFIWENK